VNKYRAYVRLRGAAKGGRAEDGAASPRSVGALGGLSLSGERSWGGSVSEGAALPPPPPARPRAPAPRRAPRLTAALVAKEVAPPPPKAPPAPRARPPPKRRLELPVASPRKTRRSL
jgi:hypothetical protein